MNQNLSSNTILAADLFCGAGGGSTAFIAACEELGFDFDLTAINHWDKAIETHTANHPGVRHLCENLECVYPPQVVPGGKLHFALFAPECTNHSRAKGGRPKNEQSRATAWHVVRWAEELDIENILVENVKEFLDWGPLYPEGHPQAGKPIPEKKGTYYRDWLQSLRKRGYKCEHRILSAAHFGAATSRERYSLQAKKIREGKQTRITWPEATHSPKENLFGLPPFRAAREVIDWELEGRSIYGRKKPLAENTMRRIYAGLRKFSGLPFLLGQQSCAAPRDVNMPAPTIAGSGAISFIQPFVVVFRNNRDAMSLEDPLSTITTSGKHHGLAEPYIVHMEHSTEASDHARQSLSPDDPLPTLTSRAAFGVCDPFVVPVTHSKDMERTHDVDKPLPTITTAKGGEFAVAEPFVVPVTHAGGENRAYSLEKPLPTVTGANRGEMALYEPFLTKFHGQTREGDERVYSTDEPLKTVDASNRFGVAAPYLVSFKGQDNAAPLEAPLGTLTSHDRFGLCEPFLVPPEGIHRGNIARSVEESTQTITSRGGGHLVEPFLVSYYGNGEALSVDEPLDTLTTKERFALVEPHMIETLGIDKGDIVGVLDIRFRMLQPHELSAAMGFPTGYKFSGTKEQTVKQIGNAIEFNVCRALIREMLKGYAKKGGI